MKKQIVSSIYQAVMAELSKITDVDRYVEFTIQISEGGPTTVTLRRSGEVVILEELPTGKFKLHGELLPVGDPED